MVTSNSKATEQPHYQFCNGRQIRALFVCSLFRTLNLPHIERHECPVSFANQEEITHCSGSKHLPHVKAQLCSMHNRQILTLGT